MTVLVSLSGAVNATNTGTQTINHLVEKVLNDNLTHTVLAEYISKSTCPYCPTAASQLYSIYNSSDYDFHYVTIVTDKIKELPEFAQLRLDNRLKELGVKYVPDVYFDGGYKDLVDAQKSEVPYRDSINQSGTRDVPEVSIDLNVVWSGANTIKITAQIQTNDSEFKGNVRIYVTEIVSHWKDEKGKQYHYAVLDMPVNKSLNAVQQLTDLNLQTQPRTLDTKSYTITKSWSGNITKDNCMVVASVFDKDTDYAVQTASAKPVSTSCNDLSYTLNGDGYTNITVIDAWNMTQCLCGGTYAPIDVRTDSEWIAEHIATPYPQYAQHWPNLQNGENLSKFMDFYQGQQVIIYCNTGVRSFQAVKLLIANGFDGTIYNMIGGITEWKKQSLPVKPNEAPTKPNITATSHGVVGIPYKYTFTTSDSDYDDIYYCIQWDNSSKSECVGPFSVSEQGSATHTYETEGSYTIHVTAMDRYGFKSEVATLRIPMPKNIQMPHFFLEKFQNILGVLRHLFKL